MTAFQEHPWLIYLCYAIAAMAVVYAIQLQMSLRPGAKPARGIVVWREDLPEVASAQLAAVSGESRYESRDDRNTTTESWVTPEGESLFIHVRRTRGKGAPAPYNASARVVGGRASIGYRLSPLIPLIYVGLAIFVFMVMEGGWVAWSFALLVVGLFFFTVANTRNAVLEAVREMKPINKVAVEQTVETP